MNNRLKKLNRALRHRMAEGLPPPVFAPGDSGALAAGVALMPANPKPNPRLALSELSDAERASYYDLLAKHVDHLMPRGPSANGTAFFAVVIFDPAKPNMVEWVSNAAAGELGIALRHLGERIGAEELSKFLGGLPVKGLPNGSDR